MRPGKGSVFGGADAKSGGGAGSATGMAKVVLPGSGVEATAWFVGLGGFTMSA
jgi:hypothetical protein